MNSNLCTPILFHDYYYHNTRFPGHSNSQLLTPEAHTLPGKLQGKSLLAKPVAVISSLLGFFHTLQGVLFFKQFMQQNVP